MSKPEALLDARAEALALLQRWQHNRTTLWVYMAANDASLATVMKASVNDVSRCLVLKNEVTVVQVDLEKARFRIAPLQVFQAPSHLGRIAAISQKPDGLIGQSGLHVTTESAKVFLCEPSRSFEEFEAMAMGGLLT